MHKYPPFWLTHIMSPRQASGMVRHSSISKHCPDWRSRSKPLVHCACAFPGLGRQRARMVTVSILLNPGMSETREARSDANTSSRAGPGGVLRSGLLGPRAAAILSRTGRRVAERTRGQRLGPPSHCRAHGASTWFCLALFSNSALNQLEEEC